MAEGEACLLDSNILLRISKSDDPQHPVITRALRTLVGAWDAPLLYVADARRILERLDPSASRA